MIPAAWSLCGRSWCETASNASLQSRKITPMTLLSSKAALHLSVVKSRKVSVDLSFLNPHWLSLNILCICTWLSSMVGFLRAG